MIIRWDETGRDVTDLPGLWCDSDCEVCETRFPHPTITEGQHTNGPASFWIRLMNGIGEWILTDCRNFSCVRRHWLNSKMLLPDGQGVN